LAHNCLTVYAQVSRELRDSIGKEIHD